MGGESVKLKKKTLCWLLYSVHCKVVNAATVFVLAGVC